MNGRAYRSDLRKLCAELAELDVRREELRGRRDEMIRTLREEGSSWAALQGDSGLTSGAIQGILAKGK